jgi:hypothetical protein
MHMGMYMGMYISMWHPSMEQVVCQHPIGSLKRTHRSQSDTGSPAVDVALHSKPQVARIEPGVRLIRRHWGERLGHNVQGSR